MFAFITTPAQTKGFLKKLLAGVTELPTITLVLSVICAAVMLLPDVSQAMAFDRGAIASGQWSRLLTGHLTHWNFDHYLWDAAVFLALGAHCELRDRARYVWSLFLSALFISLLVWFWIPDLTTYRGLSGLDSALFVLLAGNMLADKWLARQWTWVAAIVVSLVGFGLKLGYEIFTGQTLFVDSVTADFIPLASAHAVGACVGLAMTNWSGRFVRYSRRQPYGANSIISSL